MSQDNEQRLKVSLVGRILDRAVALASPSRGAKRARARLEFELLSAYSGAAKDRHTKNWRAPHGKADNVNFADLPTLIDRSRDLGRNSPYGRSISGAVKRNVVGTGIEMRAAVKPTRRNKISKAAADAFNRDWTDLFWTLCNDHELVDKEGKKTFAKLQVMTVQAVQEGGELYVIASHEPGQAPGMGCRFQAVEPEQLATSLARARSATENEIRGGIEVDAYGREVAYWFYLDMGMYAAQLEPTRVPAYMDIGGRQIRRVFHVFDQERPGQCRGVPRNTPVMLRMRDLDSYDRYEVRGKKIEAAIALTINGNASTGGGVPTISDAGEATTSTDEAGNPFANIEEALIFQAPTGTTVAGMNTMRPGSSYEPFMRQNQRAIAGGAEISYETLTSDYSQTSYSSGRMGKSEERRGFRMTRQHLVVDLLCQPWMEFCLFFAVAEGAVDCPGYETNWREWSYARWVAPGWEAIDPEKEANANKINIDYRLTTRARIAMEAGEDVMEGFDQQAIESRAAADRELNLPEEKDRTAIKQEMIKGFLADDMACRLVTNATNLGDLIQSAVGKNCRNTAYQVPCLPIDIAPPPGMVPDPNPTESPEEMPGQSDGTVPKGGL